MAFDYTCTVNTVTGKLFYIESCPYKTVPKCLEGVKPVALRPNQFDLPRKRSNQFRYRSTQKRFCQVSAR